MTEDQPAAKRSKTVTPVRRAILHGLGIVMPPLLTILLFVWAWNTTENYVLTPLESGVRNLLVWTISETYEAAPPNSKALTPGKLEDGFRHDGRDFVPDKTGRRYLPREVVDFVDQNLEQLDFNEVPPATASAYWHRYIQMKYLPSTFVVPVFLILFLTTLYFLGRMFAHGFGRLFIKGMDRLILSLPIVSQVYSSVKQVTDFFFTGEREIEFNRVVAVQYPREGMWSVGFVTGQSMADIGAAANEPVLSVLMPTSPMPMTGFTITVRKSETVDLDVTVDQAIQFVVSAGVVIPPNQRQASNRLQLDLPETQSEPAKIEDDVKPNDSATASPDAQA